MASRIPTTEITGVRGALVKRFAKPSELIVRGRLIRETTNRIAPRERSSWP